jgi:uncharacterized protein DUF6665
MALRIPRGPKQAGTGLDVLEYELFQEKAANIARLGRRLEQALEALRAFDDAAAHAPAGSAEEDAARREALVAAAGEALWYYVVQREVCGLHDGDAVIRHLGVPREVRLRMGVRPPSPPR